ncbi:MAG: helical backbone metal receptor [Treponema sp.]|nr:helical backbone metal receptor [Treponema sp.]
MNRFYKGEESLPLGRISSRPTPSNGLHAPARNAWLILSLLLLFSFTGCNKKVSANNNYPKSIVALSPSASEILFALGAGKQVSAVSEFTDYPQEAAALPKVGGFDGKTLSLEKILSFKPDFVYMTDGMHNFLVEDFESYGIKYYLSKANSIDSIYQEISDISKITGHQKEGQELINKIQKEINEVKIDTNYQPLVYWEVWYSPYMSAGSQSFINDIISKAGGKNIFSDLDQLYPIVSEESIIVRQPQVILIPQTSGITIESVKERIGWKNIPAVENSKIQIIDDNLFTRPGPRIGQSVIELNKILYE